MNSYSQQASRNSTLKKALKTSLSAARIVVLPANRLPKVRGSILSLFAANAEKKQRSPLSRARTEPFSAANAMQSQKPEQIPLHIPFFPFVLYSKRAYLVKRYTLFSFCLFQPVVFQPYMGPYALQARKSAPSGSLVPKAFQLAGRKIFSSGTLCSPTGMRSMAHMVIRSAPMWP